MKTNASFLSSIVGLVLLGAPALKADLIKVDFTAFPGADNILGTADDTAALARFTNEYAFLSGGVGFTVDSLCCGSSGLDLGAIEIIDSLNSLVEARPDIGSTDFSLGDLAINMVSSTDGITHSSVRSIDVRFDPGATGSISFFNSRNDLRFRTSVPAGGSNNVLYSDADGIARIVFSGAGAINLFEFDASAAITSLPPDPVVPEPASFGLFGLGLIPIAVTRRKVTKRKGKQ